VVALPGELLSLPFVHAGQPIRAKRGRWPDARVIGSRAVTEGFHVCTIQFDPCAYLISAADGPVTGDENIDVVRHALEQSQPDEVVLDRIRGPQVGEWHQDVGKHVAGDENTAPPDQQRRMALGMRRMLDDADFRAIPRNLRSFGRQTGNEAEQVQRYLVGDLRREPLDDAGLPALVRRRSRMAAAQRAVPYRGASPSSACQST